MGKVAIGRGGIGKSGKPGKRAKRNVRGGDDRETGLVIDEVTRGC
jgi:hypothetical protein|tara:strand:- start:56 stop:190 length:135 start_codon:yes stop_codon:yes gene_type:complete